MLLSKNKHLIVLISAVWLLLQFFYFSDVAKCEEIQIYDSLDSKETNSYKIDEDFNSEDSNNYDSINDYEIKEALQKSDIKVDYEVVSGSENEQITDNNEIKNPDAQVYFELEDTSDDINSNKAQSITETDVSGDAFHSEGSFYDDLDGKSYKEKKYSIEDIEDVEVPITLNDINIGVSKNTQKIDLPTSIQLALAQNFNIKINNAKNLQEKWKFAQALGNLLPDVTLGYAHSRYQGNVLIDGLIPAKVLRTSIQPSLRAEAQVFKGFQGVFNALSAKHQYNASKESLEANVTETIYSVTEAYYNLLREKAKLLVAEKAVEEANDQLRINKERLYAGVGTKFDVLQSESLVSDTEQQLVESENSLRLSIVMFANYLGIDLFSELLPVEDKVEIKTLIPSDITLEDTVDIALLNRSEVERDRQLIKSLIMQRRAAYSTYFPQATVSGGLQGSGSKLNNIQRSQYISVNLNWIGLNKLGTSGILKSKEIGAQVKEARLNLQNTVRSIQEEVINAYYNKESARKVLESAKKKVRADREALRLARLRLQAGVGTNSDYITAQHDLTKSQVNWINSVIDYNLAEAKLLKLMGVINIERLAKGVNKEDLISLNGVK